MTMRTDGYRLSLQGSSSAPTDMIAAARASFQRQSNFDDLMNQTGGAPPTPAQLCAAIELERSLLAS